jgi:hypothetical protein
MKIAIATLSTPDFADIAEPGNIFKKRYCNHYGYDFHYTTEHIAPERHPSWSKIPFVQRLLPDYDWVVWMDADAYISIPTIRLEWFIEQAKGKPYIIGCIGKGINHGVWMLQNCEWSREFYVCVWNHPLDHKGGCDKYGRRLGAPWEEAAVKRIALQWCCNWHTLDRPYFTENKPGEELFILHLWGMRREQRHYLLPSLVMKWEKTYEEAGL